MIWALIVIAFTTVLVLDTYEDPSRFSVVWELSDEAKSFYEESESDEGPTYIIDLTYEDGTSARVRFPLFESLDFQEFEGKINRHAEREGKRVSEAELRRFFSAVTQKNKEAEAASLEYRRAFALKSAEQRRDRLQFVQIAALVLIIPPLVLLSLGYGIAWIRRGFQTAS